MVLNFQVFGLNTTQAKLLKSSVIVQQGIKESMPKIGMLLQSKVKSSIAGREAEPASVDTGRLLNSVDFKTTNTEADVFTDVDYGKYIEFGTSKTQARHHFRNSLNRNKEEVRKIVANAVGGK